MLELSPAFRIEGTWQVADHDTPPLQVKPERRLPGRTKCWRTAAAPHEQPWQADVPQQLLRSCWYEIVPYCDRAAAEGRIAELPAARRRAARARQATPAARHAQVGGSGLADGVAARAAAERIPHGGGGGAAHDGGAPGTQAAGRTTTIRTMVAERPRRAGAGEVHERGGSRAPRGGYLDVAALSCGQALDHERPLPLVPLPLWAAGHDGHRAGVKVGVAAAGGVAVAGGYSGIDLRGAGIGCCG